ncbi:MAG: hypothetical protein MHPSP_001738, partial [Paramarteilia canceri]
KILKSVIESTANDSQDANTSHVLAQKTPTSLDDLNEQQGIRFSTPSKNSSSPNELCDISENSMSQFNASQCNIHFDPDLLDEKLFAHRKYVSELEIDLKFKNNKINEMNQTIIQLNDKISLMQKALDNSSLNHSKDEKIDSKNSIKKSLTETNESKMLLLKYLQQLYSKKIHCPEKKAMKTTSPLDPDYNIVISSAKYNRFNNNIYYSNWLVMNKLSLESIVNLPMAKCVFQLDLSSLDVDIIDVNRPFRTLTISSELSQFQLNNSRPKTEMEIIEKDISQILESGSVIEANIQNCQNFLVFYKRDHKQVVVAFEDDASSNKPNKECLVFESESAPSSAIESPDVSVSNVKLVFTYGNNMYFLRFLSKFILLSLTVVLNDKLGNMISKDLIMDENFQFFGGSMSNKSLLLFSNCGLVSIEIEFLKNQSREPRIKQIPLNTKSPIRQLSWMGNEVFLIQTDDSYQLFHNELGTILNQIVSFQGRKISASTMTRNLILSVSESGEFCAFTKVSFQIVLELNLKPQLQQCIDQRLQGLARNNVPSEIDSSQQHKVTSIATNSNQIFFGTNFGAILCLCVQSSLDENFNLNILHRQLVMSSLQFGHSVKEIICKPIQKVLKNGTGFKMNRIIFIGEGFVDLRPSMGNYNLIQICYF